MCKKNIGEYAVLNLEVNEYLEEEEAKERAITCRWTMDDDPSLQYIVMVMSRVEK